MSSPSMPPDNSAQVAQIQAQEADKARQDAADAAAKQAADLAALRTSSAASATQSAKDYFTQQGLDPSQYTNDIDSQITGILSGISPTDPNPGAAFNDIGQRIYNNDTTAFQSKEQAALDKLFPGNFETQRVSQSTIDPFIQGQDATQRSNADAIIQNMLSRGVITPAGKTAAEAELDRQNPGVLAQLNQTGQGVIATEQQALRDIANQGRTTAGTLKLGDTFDPNTYGSQADKQFTDFINNLGTTFAGKIGSANLFNTTGLAAIAGAGQGAGNTAFDPAAAAGAIDPNKNTTPKTQANAVF